MPYLVTVCRSAHIHQGLSSPVRAAAGSNALPGPPGPGRPVELLAGIDFDDSDLTDRGWFTDTDAIASQLEQQCAWLESATWTEIFSFRPTMELVSRAVFQRLRENVVGLRYIALVDVDLGVVTRYNELD